MLCLRGFGHAVPSFLPPVHVRNEILHIKVSSNYNARSSLSSQVCTGWPYTNIHAVHVYHFMTWPQDNFCR
jgi:hypothetical protein